MLRERAAPYLPDMSCNQRRHDAAEWVPGAGKTWIKSIVLGQICMYMYRELVVSDMGRHGGEIGMIDGARTWAHVLCTCMYGLCMQNNLPRRQIPSSRLLVSAVRRAR